MPKISVNKDLFFQRLGKRYTEDEFIELCMRLIIELDEEGSTSVKWKIQVPPNRYDLWCLEGLVQYLKVFLGEMKSPSFRAVEGCPTLLIKPSVGTMNTVAAVLKDIQLDSSDPLNSLNDFVDQLHRNVGRNNTLAIRILDLDKIKKAFDPEGSNVLCLPPIINEDESEVTLKTKNVLIECTATDSTKARAVLNTLTCMFSGYCKEPFTVEMCESEFKNSSGEVTKKKYPDLTIRQLNVKVKDINQLIGINLSAEAIVGLLTKVGLDASVENENLVVQIPPYRHDIIHACDVYGNVAVAYGYDTIAEAALTTYTFGSQTGINKLTELLRPELMAAGYTEVVPFILCSKEDIGEKLRKPMPSSAVTISNPRVSDFQVVRTELLPGLLKTISNNLHMPLPLKIFEIADVALKDPSQDVGAKNERRLCAVYYDKSPRFEVLHGLLDCVMKLLVVPFHPEGGNCGYHLKPIEDDTYFSGRTAEIICKGHPIGVLGNIHPEVITNFELDMPCSCLEIKIEPFL